MRGLWSPQVKRRIGVSDPYGWETMEAAKAAVEGAAEVPEAAATFGMIREVLAMEHAEIVHVR